MEQDRPDLETNIHVAEYDECATNPQKLETIKHEDSRQSCGPACTGVRRWKMPAQPIIDSHVHFWPEESSNENAHPWMTPGMPLAKQHLLVDYCTISKQDEPRGQGAIGPKGIIYIETDRRYETPNDDVSKWATGPLDEISFLQKVTEGKYGDKDDEILLGIVLWAPLDQPLEVLKAYVKLAEERMDSRAWRRVKGFRFLLQAILDKAKFEKLVFGDNFVGNLKWLGKQGFSFDIGVDQRSGGSWQLGAISRAMELAHAGVPEPQKTYFIVNHLYKPDFSGQEASFQCWCDAISCMSKLPNTYMKLSGAFSELEEELKSAPEASEHLRPWLTHLFQTFGPTRVMFGSDWPVCNVGGPYGEESWTAWKEIVELVLADETYGFSEFERGCIWNFTAARAYRLG